VARLLLMEGCEASFAGGEHQLGALHLAARQGHAGVIEHLVRVPC
jgi:hypothetical protein